MADKIKQGKIRYIPTGVVFTLPEKDAIETLKADRGNFEIVDNSFVFPEPKGVNEVGSPDDKTAPPVVKEVKTTTYLQVVGANEGAKEENAPAYDEEERKNELEKLKVAELLAICDERKIAYEKTDNKADLVLKIIEAETAQKAVVEAGATVNQQVVE